jgi:hypothetical protein
MPAQSLAYGRVFFLMPVSGAAFIFVNLLKHSAFLEFIRCFNAKYSAKHELMINVKTKPGVKRMVQKKTCFLLPVLILIVYGSAFARNPSDWARIRLDYARKEKVAQLREFCGRMHGLARQAASDETVLRFFDINRRYAEAERKGDAPVALRENVEILREEFNTYYIQNYFSFYDILFVDRDGDIFYTIRKESDFEGNLFTAETAPLALAPCIAQEPESETFVDFHLYGPSGAAAAFFVEPAVKNGAAAGWLVLQCAVNKLNSIFAWTEDLGQTGETFLVNENGYMLTESNFAGESTILRKHLDDRNIQAKFAEGEGHRTVTDYRGQTALSSFEVFPFLGVRWLVVAKMDHDEIVTSHYTRHDRYYSDRFIARLSEMELPPGREAQPEKGEEVLRVDMDEYRKARPGEALETFGVSTCTALIATFPDTFGYMAHISVRDRMYGASVTNLLGQMLKKITTFDIYLSEKRKLQFLIAAPHTQTVSAIARTLIDRGFMLSQIGVLYHPEADSAAITWACSGNCLQVDWKISGSESARITWTSEDAVNMGEVIEEIMQDEENGVD